MNQSRLNRCVRLFSFHCNASQRTQQSPRLRTTTMLPFASIFLFCRVCVACYVVIATNFPRIPISELQHHHCHTFASITLQLPFYQQSMFMLQRENESHFRRSLKALIKTWLAAVLLVQLESQIWSDSGEKFPPPTRSLWLPPHGELAWGCCAMSLHYIASAL